MSEKSKLPPIEYRALRRKEEGTFERLLCQGLIVANSSAGLKKIVKMCEMVMMTQGNPPNINRDEVEVIHSVAVGFKQSSHRSWNQADFCIMSWPFEDTDENYEKYIKPWRQVGSLMHYPIVGFYGYNYEEAYPDASEMIGRIREKFGEPGYFFVITTGILGSRGLLSESAYQTLLSQFLIWATPKVQEWYGELTKLVDQSVFDAILKTMYGTKEQGER